MSRKRDLLTAASLVPELIADNLEAELDVLSEEDAGCVAMLINHLRTPANQDAYAFRAVSQFLQRTVH